MKRGYSRCSTNETKQDIGRQVRELKAGCAEIVYMEYEHGDAKVKSQQAQMFADAEAATPFLCWRSRDLPEAPSSFVRSSRSSEKSACGW